MQLIRDLVFKLKENDSIFSSDARVSCETIQDFLCRLSETVSTLTETYLTSPLISELFHKLKSVESSLNSLVQTADEIASSLEIKILNGYEGNTIF